MKKFLSVLFALLMIFSLVSCSNINSGDGNDTDTGADTADISGNDTTALNAPPEFEIKEEIIVVHETEDGRKSTKVLRYPQIRGMEDEEKQSAVNSLFLDIAERQFILNVPDVDIYIIEDTIFNYEVSDVEVTYLSSSFISVKNTVYSMTSMAEYPDCPVYTVNIDLEKGEIIDEDDIIGDFNIISSKFLAGDFTMVDGAENLMENTNYEDMILQYKSDYASYPEIYFTVDSLFLCIDLVPALGSAATFSIPLSEIADALILNPIK